MPRVMSVLLLYLPTGTNEEAKKKIFDEIFRVLVSNPVYGFEKTNFGLTTATTKNGSMEIDIVYDQIDPTFQVPWKVQKLKSATTGILRNIFPNANFSFRYRTQWSRELRHA